jgi:hypothetical protein
VHNNGGDVPFHPLPRVGGGNTESDVQGTSENNQVDNSESLMN